MKLKLLLLLVAIGISNHIFSQHGIIACDKYIINKISTNPDFDDVFDVNVTNADTTFWVYARLDFISLSGDTIASVPSCGCSLLAGGGTETIMVNIGKTFIVPDNFSCYVVVGNTYPACKKLYKSSPSSTKDLSRNNTGLRFYPNPAKGGSITAELFSFTGNITTTLSIINLQGQRVYTQPLTSQSTKINTASLSAGIYFVQLYADGALTTTKKLVIE